MNEILDSIWKRVVGGVDWLKQVIYGEFDENREMSAVIADMLLSFTPGVIIVTSARDLTAVIVRLAKHPEKREHVTEWMLLIACAIPLVLPLLAAAAGAVVAGVGAVVGGIGGSEAGAALRAVCLLLIKEGGRALIELAGFLRRFIKGDILAVLRDIKFAKYGQALVKYIGEFIGKLVGIIHDVRAELLKVDAFNWLSGVLHKLEELERGFYGVQTSAVKAIPKALAELDARLQKALAEALPHEPRLAHAGVPAPKPASIKRDPARVPAMPGNRLGHPSDVHPVAPAGKVEKEPNLHPEDPREPKLAVMKEEKVPCFKADNLPAAKAAEMDRQLAGQQAGLNDMTVQEYVDGRKAFADRKLETGSGRGSGTPASEARNKYESDLTKRLRGEYMALGTMSDAEAKAKALDETANQMRTLAALHNPDMVVGGPNVIKELGHYCPVK